jgi:hypothetical protein
MAEPKMNPNSQEQMMLMQSFEQLANAVGADLPMAVQSEIEAVKQGKRMSDELQRMMAEGSMSFMNQLNPEMMPETEMSYEVDGRKERMSPEMMDNMVSSGQISPNEMSTYMVDGREERLAPSQMGGITPMPSRDEMTYGPSSGITVDQNVMSLDDAIAAGLVKPTRPQARPSAPTSSMRPRMRP